MAEVTRLARDLGIHVHHCGMTRSQPGWPDLVLAGWHGTLFRELKTAFQEPTSEQREVGYRLQASGLDWALWRPRDLDDGTVKRQLEAIA